MIRSVRGRTALLAGAVFALSITLISVLLVMQLRSSLIAEVDRSNDARAADLISNVDATSSVAVDLGLSLDNDTIVMVVVENELYGTNDEAADWTIVDAAFDAFDEPFEIDLSATATIDGADNLRGVGLGFEDGTQDYVFAGSSLDPVDRTVARVRNLLLVTVPLLVAMVGGLVWWLTGRSLRPVEAIRSEAAAISLDELHRRVPTPNSSDEIAKLAETMNEMLARLEASQKHQQQFVSDASHELRSPLASIVAQLEVDAAHPDGADHRATAGFVHAEARRMQSLTEGLLLLARSDAGEIIGRRTLVDLDDVVLSAAASFAKPTAISVDTSAVSAGLVSGDDDQLRQVVANLLNNAVRHAVSSVAVGVKQSPEGVSLWVDDDGAGIALADRSLVFERFVRLDEARSRDGGGSGLGLAISAEIVRAHGGNIAIHDAPLGGARFVVSLPGS